MKSKKSHKPYASSSKRAPTQPEQDIFSVIASSSAIPRPDHRPYLDIPKNTKVPYRDVCEKVARNLHPDVKPRNDWDLLQLASIPLPVKPEEVYVALDKLFDATMMGQTHAEMIQGATYMLGLMVEPTGIKPCPGDQDKSIQIRPIPDSKYSIRLFPGSFTDAEYCMDFVDSETGESVNTPFECELHAGPGETDTPWMNFPHSMRIKSIEVARGRKFKDILPGEEKYILRDGQQCVLIRPGKPKIRFTVPIRKRPRSEPVKEEGTIYLDFPKMIELGP
ncbi:hypothetical protein C8Q70DRAFT_264701 [Cubamyces menziesii]|nr:hypothetical protein C8Q70DRAFT_264701 [Cubamyces menziesii]